MGKRTNTKEELRYGDIPFTHINGIKQNAIKRNLEFTLTNEYLWNLFLNQNKKCILSNVDLCFTPNSNTHDGRRDTTASLDRIDNNKGYIEGNVRWIHKTINKMRNNLDDSVFLEWCKKCYISSHNINGVEFEKYSPPEWDEWFFRHVYLVATKSKDLKTKIGSVLVKDKRIISTGYNGFCIGVDDSINQRFDRPDKYLWTEHSERNCIFSASRNGISTYGNTLYTNGIPCVDCARAIIQSGIKKVITHKTFDDLFQKRRELEATGNGIQWVGHGKVTTTMFKEAGVEWSSYDNYLGVETYLDGKVYIV